MRIGLKRGIAVIIGTLLVLLPSIGLLLYFDNRAKNSNEVLLYYFDSQTYQWKTEPFNMKNISAGEFVKSAVSRLQRITEQSASNKAIPKDAKVSEITLENGIAEITLAESFNDLPLLDRNVCIASIVYSLTGISDVDGIRIYSGAEELTGGDGSPLGVLNTGCIVINTELLPLNTSIKRIKLYFADESYTYLVEEERSIVVQPNKDLINYVVEELIKGPQEKQSYRLLPTDTKIRTDVKIDKDICYVDFASDFMTRLDGDETAALLAIYSIVNSLIDNSGAKQVQILFAGDKYSAYQSEALDFGKPFERNVSLMQ